MQNDTKLQALLAKVRKDYCRDNATELARRIGKDASYVHRLFYPSDKKGAKGSGLEIMNSCTQAFKLPPGYWDGAVPEQSTVAMEPPAPYTIPPQTVDEWTAAAISIMKKRFTLGYCIKQYLWVYFTPYRQFPGGLE